MATAKKPAVKAAKKQKTHVFFILDRSGSMSSCQDATVSGFNEYLNDLKKDRKSDYIFTLSLFDTEVDIVQEGVPIKEVDDLSRATYRPDGMTALYDAVCSTINRLGEEVGKKEKGLVVIMTDGCENSSREYTEKDMAKMVKDLEGKGNWKFTFLGANQDSYIAAQKMGVGKGNTANYHASAAGLEATFSTMSANTRGFAAASLGASAKTDFYSKDDKEKLENTK